MKTPTINVASPFGGAGEMLGATLYNQASPFPVNVTLSMGVLQNGLSCLNTRISRLSHHPGPGILYITVKGGQNFGQITVQVSGGIIEAAYYLVRLGGLTMAGHS